MSWHRLKRSSRTGVAAIALLLFMGGSNFCLLSVLAGGSMSCLTAPGATHGGTSHCGHALPQSSEGEAAPAGSGNSPCCVTVAPVQTFQVQKADAGDIHTVFALAEPSVESWQGETRFGPVPDQKPPPTSPPTARHSGRAPPLS